MLVALLSNKRGEADEVLSGLALRLESGGYRLAGLVQTNVARPGRCRCDMVLRELAGGREIAISQDLGDGARGCRLDQGALATAAGWVEGSISTDIDVLVLNKFGRREAEGAGLRAAIAAAVELDIPVIVGLAPENREAWDVFCGGAGEVHSVASTNEILARLANRRGAPSEPIHKYPSANVFKMSCDTTTMKEFRMKPLL